jgi:competence protein ComEC
MTVTIACVDVGQGDCTVAVDENTGEGLLIDCCGGKYQRAVDELRSLGLTELRDAIVSHTQQDHFGGVLDTLELLADRFTGTLHFNLDSFKAMPTAGEERRVAGQRLRALINRASEFGDRVRVERAEAPAPPGMVGSLSWELLAPSYAEILTAHTKGDPNLASGIVLLRVGSDAVVIGGDAQLAAWERVAEHIPKAAVVRWPHHGGAIDDDPDAHAKLRELLQPATVIVSVGARNGNGHPTRSFFAALGGRPGRLLCTQATPACVAGGGPGGVCAGTIRIRADGSGSPAVVPSPPDHAAVIAAFGNGQCR